MLGGCERTRSGQSARVLQGALRLGVRGRVARGLWREVLRRQAPGRQFVDLRSLRRAAQRRRCRCPLNTCGGPGNGDVEHVLLGRQRRRGRVPGPRCRRCRPDGALRPPGRLPDGDLQRSRGRGVRSVGGEGAQGRAAGQRPGAVVFNGLNTRDVEGAKSFYGSVFGWHTGSIGGGAEGWTLPGYGDWLEREHHPDLRKQMAEAGAPEGFEDIVASIIPIADDQPDTPPHWSVIFAVADADATAAKATELGGKVIVPPFDAPWSTRTYTIRMTVIGDPQGATFSASEFIDLRLRPGRARICS